MRLFGGADGARVQAALWLGVAAEAGGRAGAAAGAALGAAMAPLAEAFAGRFRSFLPIATYPVRVGTHFNTAFALRMAADYAEGAGDAALLALLAGTAERWYGGDVDCPAWGEPSQDDFLSSALIEAECMRRLMPPGQFGRWFDAVSAADWRRSEPADAVCAGRADATGRTARSRISTG